MAELGVIPITTYLLSGETPSGPSTERPFETGKTASQEGDVFFRIFKDPFVGKGKNLKFCFGGSCEPRKKPTWFNTDADNGLRFIINPHITGVGCHPPIYPKQPGFFVHVSCSSSLASKKVWLILSKVWKLPGKEPVFNRNRLESCPKKWVHSGVHTGS